MARDCLGCLLLHHPPMSKGHGGGRNHYQGLDLLRGVAAIAVVEFHFNNRLNLPGLFWHGYLAVDFFFVLSGFVIAHAYGERLASGAMGLREFITLRAIRLLPLVVFGTLIAAVADLLRPGDFTMAQHLTDIGVAMLMGFLCLPTLWQTTLERTVFPLNSPVWSLFFELLANLCFAPLYRISHSGRVIAVICGASLIAIIWTILANGSASLGSKPTDFVFGLPRVAWSFSLGILLSRIRVNIPPMSSMVYAAILCAILACPHLPNRMSHADELNALFDVVAVCIVFPLIVLGVSHCHYAEGPSGISAWCGNMSYPLYATHYPLIRAVGSIGREFSGTVTAHLLVATFGTIAMVLFASGVYTAYDAPLRRWITCKIRPPK